MFNPINTNGYMFNVNDTEELQYHRNDDSHEYYETVMYLETPFDEMCDILKAALVENERLRNENDGNEQGIRLQNFRLLLSNLINKVTIENEDITNNPQQAPQPPI